MNEIRFELAHFKVRTIVEKDSVTRIASSLFKSVLYYYQSYDLARKEKLKQKENESTQKFVQSNIDFSNISIEGLCEIYSHLLVEFKKI